LAARLEPFDSYWQAPADVDKGYKAFSAYYRANYLSRIPKDRQAKILVISCGPGYLVDLLVQSGYRHVLGIDSDAAKVEHALRRRLPCEVAQVFAFLSQHQSGEYDCIVPEQELNHLTMDSIRRSKAASSNSDALSRLSSRVLALSAKRRVSRRRRSDGARISS